MNKNQKLLITITLLIFSISIAWFLTKSCSQSNQLEKITFAVIGDYGADNEAELKVSKLVKSWNPDFIITVGDNNYEKGETATIDKNIGKYYHEYIGNYMGSFGEGASENKFFPCLGNHDWYSETGAMPYLDYFSLPGNERYYDFVKGHIHFFVIDSDKNEPDGINKKSIQGQWLKHSLMDSKSCFNLVYFHHPPYSSGDHGSSTKLRWPFAKWGADVVLCGHDHDYERLIVKNFPYFVVGTGGATLREFKKISKGSKVRIPNTYGALLVTGNCNELNFKFYSANENLKDEYVMKKN